MKKLAELLSKYAVPINVTATVLLLANALLILFNPRLLLQIIRYAIAAVSAALAGWNLVSLVKKQ